MPEEMTIYSTREIERISRTAADDPDIRAFMRGVRVIQAILYLYAAVLLALTAITLDIVWRKKETVPEPIIITSCMSLICAVGIIVLALSAGAAARLLVRIVFAVERK